MTDLAAPDSLIVRITRPGPETVVLGVEGELDMFTAPILAQHLAEHLNAGAPHAGSGTAWRVVLDLTGVSFMGSSGLSVLARAQRTASGGHLRLVCSPAVLRSLRSTALDSLFRIEDTVTAALADT